MQKCVADDVCNQSWWHIDLKTAILTLVTCCLYLISPCLFAFSHNLNNNSTTPNGAPLTNEAFAAKSKRYQPYLELGGAKYFNQTTQAAGIYDLFIPLYQQEEQLLFADLRIFDRSGSSFEGNLHLGYRKLHSSQERMVGFYGAFDRKRSETRNFYNQLTVGVEYWHASLFLGANLYQPIGTSQRPISPQLAAAKPGSVSIAANDYYEKALAGGDAEIGYAFSEQITGYAGGYYFHASEVATIAGPKLRLVYNYNKPHGRFLRIVDGVSFEIGAQHDKPRGYSGYIGLKVKIGLTEREKNSNISGFARHMVEPVRRDPDIVIRNIETPKEKFYQRGRQGFQGREDSSNSEDFNNWSNGSLLQELGLDPKMPEGEITAQVTKKRRFLARTAHSDRGGSDAKMARINVICDILKQRASFNRSVSDAYPEAEHTTAATTNSTSTSRTTTTTTSTATNKANMVGEGSTPNGNTRKIASRMIIDTSSGPLLVPLIVPRALFPDPEIIAHNPDPDIQANGYHHPLENRGTQEDSHPSFLNPNSQAPNNALVVWHNNNSNEHEPSTTRHTANRLNYTSSVAASHQANIAASNIATREGNAITSNNTTSLYVAIEDSEVEAQSNTSINTSTPTPVTPNNANSLEDLVNLDYEYEDQDIGPLLQLRAQEVGIDLATNIILPPLEDNSEHLAEQLVEEWIRYIRRVYGGEAFPHARNIIVPLHLNQAHHWVGIVIRVNSVNQVVRVTYVDSLSDPIPRHVARVLRALYGTDIKIEHSPGYLQTDSTSCGPLLVENLIRVVLGVHFHSTVSRERLLAIRAHHVYLAERYYPELKLDHRQLHNVRSFEYLDINKLQTWERLLLDNLAATTIPQSIPEVTSNSMTSEQFGRGKVVRGGGPKKSTNSSTKSSTSGKRNRNEGNKKGKETEGGSSNDTSLSEENGKEKSEQPEQKRRRKNGDKEKKIVNGKKTKSRTKRNNSRKPGPTKKTKSQKAINLGTDKNLPPQVSSIQPQETKNSKKRGRSSSIISSTAEAPRAKKQKTEEELEKKYYKRPPLFPNGLKGDLYQIVVVIKHIWDLYDGKKDFNISTERSTLKGGLPLGKYDDLIIKEQEYTKVIQIKHAGSTNEQDRKYTVKMLCGGVKDSKEGGKKAALHMYFDSWYDIKKESKDSFRFIFYTNHDLADEVKIFYYDEDQEVEENDKNRLSGLLDLPPGPCFSEERNRDQKEIIKSFYNNSIRFKEAIAERFLLNGGEVYFKIKKGVAIKGKEWRELIDENVENIFKGLKKNEIKNDKKEFKCFIEMKALLRGCFQFDPKNKNHYIIPQGFFSFPFNKQPIHKYFREELIKVAQKYRINLESLREWEGRKPIKISEDCDKQVLGKKSSRGIKAIDKIINELIPLLEDGDKIFFDVTNKETLKNIISLPNEFSDEEFEKHVVFMLTLLCGNSDYNANGNSSGNNANITCIKYIPHIYKLDELYNPDMRELYDLQKILVSSLILDRKDFKLPGLQFDNLLVKSTNSTSYRLKEVDDLIQKFIRDFEMLIKREDLEELTDGLKKDIEPKLRKKFEIEEPAFRNPEFYKDLLEFFLNDLCNIEANEVTWEKVEEIFKETKIKIQVNKLLILTTDKCKKIIGNKESIVDTSDFDHSSPIVLVNGRKKLGKTFAACSWICEKQRQHLGNFIYGFIPTSSELEAWHIEAFRSKIFKPEEKITLIIDDVGKIWNEGVENDLKGKVGELINIATDLQENNKNRNKQLFLICSDEKSNNLEIFLKEECSVSFDTVNIKPLTTKQICKILEVSGKSINDYLIVGNIYAKLKDLLNEENEGSGLAKVIRTPGYLLALKDHIMTQTQLEKIIDEDSKKDKDIYISPRVIIKKPPTYDGFHKVLSELLPAKLVIYSSSLGFEDIDNAFFSDKEKFEYVPIEQLLTEFLRGEKTKKTLVLNCSDYRKMKIVIEQQNKLRKIENFIVITNSNRLVHELSSFVENRYEILNTSGDCYLINNENDIWIENEDRNWQDSILQSNSNGQGKRIIVASDAGMGKSTTVKQLTTIRNIGRNISLEDRHNHNYYHWRIAVVLDELTPKYNSKRLNDFLFEQYIQYFNIPYGQNLENVEWIRNAISYDLKQKNVLLLLDGGDEVKKSDIEGCHDIYNQLLDYYNVMLFTRPDQLLLPFIYNTNLSLQKFQDKQIKEYFTQAFPNPPNNPFCRIATDTIEKNNELREMLGEPLLCKLLWKSWEIDYENWINNNGSNKPKGIKGSNAIIVLYEKFIETKLRIYFNRILKGSEILNEDNYLYRINYWGRGYIGRMAQVAAADYFSDISNELSTKLHKVKGKKWLDNDIQDIALVRRWEIRVDKSVNYRFFHRTYQEYLAAKFFIDGILGHANPKQIEWCKEILNIGRFIHRYQNFWKFVFAWTKNPSRSKRSHNNIDKFEEQFKKSEDLISKLENEYWNFYCNKEKIPEAYEPRFSFIEDNNEQIGRDSLFKSLRSQEYLNPYIYTFNGEILAGYFRYSNPCIIESITLDSEIRYFDKIRKDIDECREEKYALKDNGKKIQNAIVALTLYSNKETCLGIKMSEFAEFEERYEEIKKIIDYNLLDNMQIRNYIADALGRLWCEQKEKKESFEEYDSSIIENLAKCFNLEKIKYKDIPLAFNALQHVRVTENNVDSFVTILGFLANIEIEISEKEIEEEIIVLEVIDHMLSEISKRGEIKSLEKIKDKIIQLVNKIIAATTHWSFSAFKVFTSLNHIKGIYDKLIKYVFNMKEIKFPCEAYKDKTVRALIYAIVCPNLFGGDSSVPELFVDGMENMIRKKYTMLMKDTIEFLHEIEIDSSIAVCAWLGIKNTEFSSELSALEDNIERIDKLNLTKFDTAYEFSDLVSAVCDMKDDFNSIIAGFLINRIKGTDKKYQMDLSEHIASLLQYHSDNKIYPQLALRVYRECLENIIFPNGNKSAHITLFCENEEYNAKIAMQYAWSYYKQYRDNETIKNETIQIIWILGKLFNWPLVKSNSRLIMISPLTGNTISFKADAKGQLKGAIKLLETIRRDKAKNEDEQSVVENTQPHSNSSSSSSSSSSQMDQDEEEDESEEGNEDETNSLEDKNSESPYKSSLEEDNESGNKTTQKTKSSGSWMDQDGEEDESEEGNEDETNSLEDKNSESPYKSPLEEDNESGNSTTQKTELSYGSSSAAPSPNLQINQDKTKVKKGINTKSPSPTGNINNKSQVEMKYEYTSIDIVNIMWCEIKRRLSEANRQYQIYNENMQPLDIDEIPTIDDKSVIHEIDNRYLLYPVEETPGYCLHKYVENFLKEFKKGNGNIPDEFIIPYNSHHHWVTIHVHIVAGKLIIRYIDSLYNDNEKIRIENEDRIRNEMQLLQKTLCDEYNRTTETVEVEIAYRKVQNDEYACGPITAQQVQEILFGEPIPTSMKLMKDKDILNLRRKQHGFLNSYGLDLDK